MRRIMAGDDVARLARSAERLVRLAQAIDQRSREWVEPVDPPPPLPATSPALDDEPLVEAAREAIRADRRRPDFGSPALFRPRSWVLMLELFIADSSGADTPVKVACLSLGGSQTSALRCILDLERLGVVESRDDPRDGRRRLLSLSATARADLKAYLAASATEDRRPIRLALRMRSRIVSGVEHEADATHQVAPGSARSEVGTEMVSQ